MVHTNTATDDIRSQRDIRSLLEALARQYGDAPAIRAADGLAIGYGELHRRVVDMVAAFRARRVAPDTRIAIVLPNGLNMAIGLLGTSCAGIAVPLNPAYRESEYRTYFREAGVNILLMQEATPSVARDVAEQEGMPVFELSEDGCLENVTEIGLRPGAVGEAFAPSPERIAMMLLTSGSTGRPKKVPLSHRNLCAGAFNVADSLALGPEDCCLSMWEQHHIGGLVDLLLAPLASGGSVVCAGSFDAGRFYDLLHKTLPTWFQGVPTTLRELVVYGKSRLDSPVHSSLRFLRSVAAALPPSLMDEVEEHFGVPVIQTFGMTEASPLITTNLLPPGVRKPGSAGKPWGPEIAVMGPDGIPLGAGRYGEVAVRGENIFAGYEDDAEANAGAFKDGWFYTGDTGYLDEDGYLFLRGRVKEMINRGGEKVSPYEVEETISRHPAVSEVAAFAIPHATLGEDVGVAIVPRDSGRPSDSEIREFAAQRLSAFKIPRTVMMLDALPRCPVGKVRRRELAEMAQQLQTKDGYAAPHSELEKFLANLWATELDVWQVGIDDDFSALGGDSLSSVRLVTAIEMLLGLDFPDDVLAHLTTVRKMAQHIEKATRAHDPLNQSAAVSRSNLHDVDVRTLLASAATGDEFAHDNLQQIRRRLEHSKSILEFKASRESLLSKMTPAELVALLDTKSSVAWSDLLARIPKGFRAWRVPLELRAWSGRVRREIAGFDGAYQWRRHSLTQNIQFYSANPRHETEKTLIVGFCSSSMRLMIPISRFLMHLDAERFDVLLLRDPDRNHYVHGIPEVCSDIQSLCEWLQSRVKSMGYDNVFSIGTSAGGVASLCAGIANGWSRAIAVGADAPSNHPALEAFLISASQTASQTEVMVFYSALNQRDSRGARDIARIHPHARDFGDAASTKHNILDPAFKQGELKNMFKRFFD